MSGEKYFEGVSLYDFVSIYLYISTYLHPQQQFKITTHETSGMLQQLPQLWVVKMVVKTRYAVDAVVISLAVFTIQASLQALRDLYTYIYSYIFASSVSGENGILWCFPPLFSPHLFPGRP